MADDEDNTQETPAEETPEHAVPTEDATEIAGSAEDAALEALQESKEHPQAESAESTAEQFEPVPGNAVPSEDATEIAGSTEDAALEAAQERAEEAVGEAVAEEIVAEAIAEEVAEEVLAEAVAEELVEEAIEEAVAEEVAEEIVAEIVAEELVEEAVEEAVAEELAEEIVAEIVAEELVEEAVEEAVAEELVEEVVAEAELEAVAEEIAEEVVAEAEAEDEEDAPRVKPAVPGAHLEVDIVPEGVDPLGRDATRGDAYEDPYAIEGEEPEGDADDQDEQEEVLSKPISTAAIDLASGARYRATGKRKTAVARVTLRPGSGSYLVNGRTLEEHFPRITQQLNIRQPLETVGYQERMDVVARLHGGGISAQAGALRHGVSRALLEADPNLRGELKRRGFLTRDSRAKERKKAGLKKARKKPQFSKR
jgi:small subunit ribosomal protein S9